MVSNRFYILYCKRGNQLLKQLSFVPCPSESNMRLKQWENEVDWFDPPAGGSTPHSTLSEAAAGAAECVSNVYW